MKLRGMPAWLLATFVLPSHAGDRVFTNGFEIQPDNAGDAARFLTQATFGPTSADIAHLMAIGYDAWIAEQLALPATLSEPAVEAIVNARTNGAQGYNQSQRLNRWFWQAAYAPDQLRQRMAYALSRFVVSDQAARSGRRRTDGVLPGLARHDAFGGYRQLLGSVTYNPAGNTSTPFTTSRRSARLSAA